MAKREEAKKQLSLQNMLMNQYNGASSSNHLNLQELSKLAQYQQMNCISGNNAGQTVINTTNLVQLLCQQLIAANNIQMHHHHQKQHNQLEQSHHSSPIPNSETNEIDVSSVKLLNEEKLNKGSSSSSSSPTKRNLSQIMNDQSSSSTLTQQLNSENCDSSGHQEVACKKICKSHDDQTTEETTE